MAKESVATKLALGMAGTLKAENVDKDLEPVSQGFEFDVLET